MKNKQTTLCLLLLLLVQMSVASTCYAQVHYSVEESFGACQTVTLPEGYTGKGVLFGIVDEGIEFNHINFLDPNTLQTRVRTAFCYLNKKGEYVRANTPAEISGLTIDGGGFHGTHVAGIAAGSYSADGWHGIAPEADMCLAGIVESDRLNNMQALRQVFEVADSLNMPLVVNMSIGDKDVLDGYGDMNLLCEELTDNGNRPGRIIVVATANRGTSPAYMECSVNAEGKARLCFYDDDDFTEDTYSVSFSFEALKSKDLKFRPFLYNLSTKQEVSEGFTTPDGTPFDISSLVVNGYEKENSPYRYYSLSAELGRLSQDVVPCIEIAGEAGSELRYMHGCDRMDDDYFTVPDIVYGTPSTYATTPAVISVGMHETHMPGRTPIVDASSFGVNKYGERFPDVVAPGVAIMSSYPSFPNTKGDTFASRDVQMPDGSHKFNWASISGTSQASPLVAGICALLLQVDPTLSVNRIRELLHRTNDWNDDCTNAPMGEAQAGHGILNSKALFEAIGIGTDALNIVTENSIETTGGNLIHDLLGRQLNHVPTQGFYIRNGKIETEKQ